MDSREEIIQRRMAGIDGKPLYHRGKSGEKGKKKFEPHVFYEAGLFCHSKKPIVKPIKQEAILCYDVPSTEVQRKLCH